MSQYIEPTIEKMLDWLNEHYPHTLRAMTYSLQSCNDEEFQRRIKFLYHSKQAELKEK